jgi:hypothetical protein
VKVGRTIPVAKAKKRKIPTLTGDGFFEVVEGTVIGDGRVIVYDERITTIVDVWDLPMLGGERIEVENLYERSHFRAAPEMINLEGTFVTDGDGLFCQLLERLDRPQKNDDIKNQPYHPSKFYPAGNLPEDSVIVVRTRALRDFASRFDGKPEPVAKPVGSRERTTLLTIVAALARMAKVDVSKPSSAAAAIESQTELMGTRVAARTIEEHLKRIREALETRGQ